MLKYVIMGVQGCGKGTQAKLLAERFDVVHISVGDIFRWHIQAHTKLAAKIKRIMEAGRLVPDELVDDIVRQRLDQHDWNYGFVLDGYPRNEAQARCFLESFDTDAVIRLVVPDEVVVKRVLARRLCAECGVDYNLMYHRPSVPDVCDVCGGRLEARADDNEEAIHSRLRDYHTHTEPVIDLFRRKELVIDIDGDQPIPAVHRAVRQRLGLPELPDQEAPVAPLRDPGILLARRD